ncbi:MAG: disulfide bond formation protein B [Alphaproteobacteria bacterium]|nr:disulfide bond formation protein B [Alphaproteobacteria bacterium]
MKCAYMNNLCAKLSTKHIHYFLILISVLSLGFAYGAEYGFKILPCEFCLYERCIYAGLIVVGLLSLKTRFFSDHKGVLAQLLVLSIGIGLTFYHAGMEQHWWAAPKSCSSIQNAMTLEDFRKQLLQTPRPRCDQISWALFGISATVWNLLLQAGLAFLTSLSLYLPNNTLSDQN